jgi:uncharacterized membrane protein
MKKRIQVFLALIAIFSTIPLISHAQEVIEAEVISTNGSTILLEDEGGERYRIDSGPDTMIQNELSAGNKVTITALDDTLPKEEQTYIITGFVRIPALILLSLVFLGMLIAVNGKKAFLSLINLSATLAILFLGVTPLILKGYPPVWVTVIGGTIAMLVSIYISHGFTKKSHAAIVSIGVSLGAVGLLSSLFVDAASLTGFVSDEATLLSILNGAVSIKGLLLAGMIIGALGVLDDLTISQISLVKELLRANPNMHTKELLHAAHRVGHDHTSAMVNTLVLAYAGATFPLVMLIAIGEPPFDTLSNILNHELIATELVRTLVGSIGILCSMPISTLIAVRLYRGKAHHEPEETDHHGCSGHHH